MAKQKTERQIDFYSRYGTPKQWLGAITVGLTSGAITMYNMVTTKFDNDLAKDFELLEFFRTEEPEFNLQKIYKERAPKELKRSLLKFDDDTIQRALKAPKFEVPAELRRPSPVATHNFISETREAKSAMREFAKRVTHFGLGLESYGIKGITKGTYQRLMTFSPPSYFNIVVKSLFAVGGGIGATLMVFNQLNNRDKLNEIDKQTERTDRKIDALVDKLGVEPEAIQTRSEKKQALKEAARAERAHDSGKHAPTSSVSASNRSHERMQRSNAHELGA